MRRNKEIAVISSNKNQQLAAELHSVTTQSPVPMTDILIQRQSLSCVFALICITFKKLSLFLFTTQQLPHRSLSDTDGREVIKLKNTKCSFCPQASRGIWRGGKVIFSVHILNVKSSFNQCYFRGEKKANERHCYLSVEPQPRERVLVQASNISVSDRT